MTHEECFIVSRNDLLFIFYAVRSTPRGYHNCVSSVHKYLSVSQEFECIAGKFV